MAAGNVWKERAFIAANRVGKTVTGGYEMTCHLTGKYPEWWTGRRFDDPTDCWAAGKSSKTVRDIIQQLMLGKPGSDASFGTGMIPRDLIVRTTTKHGIADAVETIYVKHVSGGVSSLQLKSYDQGRDAYEGSSCHAIWLDEEPDESIYSECLTRTATTHGIIYVTTTPMEGLTELILQFLPGMRPALDTDEGKPPVQTKFAVQAGWDDVPHLDPLEKAALMASYAPWQRDARTRGIPMLGSGAIYQVPQSEIIIQPFQIPAHYRRCYGLDVGWNCTATVWLAHDSDTGTVYVVDEYYRGKVEPSVHAAAINNRGKWQPGVIDPAARGRMQTDGQRLLDMYLDLGLDVEKAENARESGIFAVWELLSQGRLRIFSTCQNLLREYATYRRDRNGNIVKTNDHALDALRYAVVSGLARAKIEPTDRPDGKRWFDWRPQPFWSG
jgi:phage terminase large subunit-like protein